MLDCFAEHSKGLSSDQQLIDISRLQHRIDFGRIIPEGFREIPHYFVALSAKKYRFLIFDLLYTL